MEKISLNGKWFVQEENQDKFLNASVPGEIHLDLLKNKIISEPLTGDTFVKLKELEGKNWIYEKEFKSKKTFRKACLVFEGIDGHAQIYLNGKLIGSTQNSFIRHSFDVTEYLSYNNKLQIFLNDGLNSVRKEDAEKYRPSYADVFAKEDIRRVFLRKPQFYFGWDWTQRLINCGIWRPVYLTLYQNFAIRDLQVYPEISGKVKGKLEIENFNQRPLKSQIDFRLNGSKIKEEKVSLAPGMNKIDFTFKVNNPKLWFPWNIGNPNLYSLRLTASVENKIEDEKEIIFGFRKIEVLQEKISREEGRSFTFKINGIKTFAKGANWVPADTILARVNKRKYETLLSYAGEMGVNMLRVWGGGIYEDPYFYQLCNKLGIMVWQDFMFACGYYPDDKPEFLTEVKKEAEAIVKDLRHHPSIVLWCGNNENHHIYFEEKKKNPRRVYYGRKIYHQVLPRIVKKVDPDRFYWPSSDYSPSGADLKSMKEGDRHSWYIPNINLKRYEEKGERYFFLQDKAKFVSEFGRLGFSLPATIRKATGERKIDFSSQKFKLHLNAQSFLRETITEKLIETFGERVKNLAAEDLILLSQIWQGETLNFALSHYMARRFVTSGALFWMFNDSWPTTSSWATVDYYLNKTPAFWYVKRAFQNIGVFIKPAYLISGNNVEFFLWNETLLPVEFKIEFGISTFEGRKLLSFSKRGRIKPNTSLLAGKANIPPELLARKDLIIFAVAKIEKRFITAYSLLASNWKETFLPEVEIKTEKINGKEITLKSKKFVWVCILKNVKPEDNFFHLLPGIPHRVKIMGGNMKRLKIIPVNNVIHSGFAGSCPKN